MPDLSGDPFERSSVHLLHFAEISASGASGMCVLNRHEIGLDGSRFLFGRGKLLFCKEFFFIRFLLALVAFGERIYSASRILETEDTEREMPSRSARSSV